MVSQQDLYIYCLIEGLLNRDPYLLNPSRIWFGFFEVMNISSEFEGSKRYLSDHLYMTFHLGYQMSLFWVLSAEANSILHDLYHLLGWNSNFFQCLWIIRSCELLHLRIRHLICNL